MEKSDRLHVTQGTKLNIGERKVGTLSKGNPGHHSDIPAQDASFAVCPEEGSEKPKVIGILQHLCTICSPFL